MDREDLLPVETGPSLGPFLFTSQLLTDPVPHESDVFFNSFYDETISTTIAKQTNIYAKSKIWTAYQGMGVTVARTHFSHRQHAHNGTCRDVNSTAINIFMDHLIIMGLEHKLRTDHYWSTCTLIKHLSLIYTFHKITLKTFCGTFIFLKHRKSTTCLFWT